MSPDGVQINFCNFQILETSVAKNARAMVFTIAAHAQNVCLGPN